MFCHATTCSLPCASLCSYLLLHILAYCYLLHLSHFALLLSVLSFLLGPTTTYFLPNVLLYSLPPLHFTLLQPLPSFTFCLATYLFLCISFYYFNLKCCCHSLHLVALLLDCSHFTLLLTYYELVLPHSFKFCKLRNLEQTWSFKLFQLGKFSFNLILFFFSLSF
jgi:hypothetical protein